MCLKKCIKNCNKRIKKLDVWDISLIKLASIAFVLGLIKLWSAAMAFVHNTSIWWFVAAFVIFAIRPFVRTLIK